MALCDDHKQLTLWRCEDWTLERRWQAEKRANAVAFDRKGERILIAGQFFFVGLWAVRKF